MDVSIIIVNYNTFSLTCACIASVVEHTCFVDYEILVVDNASNEKNPNEFLVHFPTVRLIKSPENLGFAKGNNLGIAIARGRYILLLNSDTEFLNNAAHTMFNFLETRKDVAVASAALFYPDGKPQHCCQRFPSLRYKMVELLRLQKLLGRKRGGQILLGPFFDYSQAVNVDWVWGTFFMFRKDLLGSLIGGKLDDTLFMYGEDMEWCLNFRRLGYRIMFNPEAKIIHYMGMSGGAKHEMMNENLEIFMRKHYGLLHRKAIALIDFLLKFRFGK
jgi:GT2 family glycosyltransferase